MKLVIGFVIASAAYASHTRVADMREASRLDQAARYADAQVLYDRIAQDAPALPPNDVLRAEWSNDLAVHYHHLARYADAEPLYRQAIEIWRQTPETSIRHDLALCLGKPRGPGSRSRTVSRR